MVTFSPLFKIRPPPTCLISEREARQKGENCQCMVVACCCLSLSLCRLPLLFAASHRFARFARFARSRAALVAPKLWCSCIFIDFDGFLWISYNLRVVVRFCSYLCVFARICAYLCVCLRVSERPEPLQAAWFHSSSHNFLGISNHCMILCSFLRFCLGAQNLSRMLDFIVVHTIFVDFEAIGIFCKV